MASRYPAVKVVDYCFNPVHVVDGDKDIVVPCGKCDGCLLHKANEWSMRCGMEIEDSAATIFGTLTYSNIYLPKLAPVYHFDGNYSWISSHKDNVRFNGVRDVLRQDEIIIHRNYAPIDITHWDNVKHPSIAYPSKRDIQLWLKNIRKDLDLYGFFAGYKHDSKRTFRYFIIAEIGPTTFRPHYHFLIFCPSREIGSYLLECSLYKNWKMCDESKFSDFAHFCDSGARGYVTQYLTQFSCLPSVYQEVKEIRPFRLASKSPGIGYIGQDKKKIYQDVERGIIKYTRPIPRLESASVLEYPADYLVTLFPKCYQFAKVSDSRRFFVYSFLYRSVRVYGFSYHLLRKRLSEIMHSADYIATCACWRFCREFVDSPMYYYYLLDNYYYKLEMSHLSIFYESMQHVDFREDKLKIFEYYSNIEMLCLADYVSDEVRKTLSYLLDPLGFDSSLLVGNKSFFTSFHNDLRRRSKDYRNEVSDIVNNMVKTAKHNEMIGAAPTSV